MKISLNPFIFRAGVQAALSEFMRCDNAVLIPLSSGLVFRPEA